MASCCRGFARQVAKLRLSESRTKLAYVMLSESNFTEGKTARGAAFAAYYTEIGNE